VRSIPHFFKIARIVTGSPTPSPTRGPSDIPIAPVCLLDDILRCIRAASRIPVLTPIARGDDEDRIVGPEPGAAASGMSIWLPPICNLCNRVLQSARTATFLNPRVR